MSEYRCCCCPVSVGSRIFAALTAIGAFLALLGNFWSPQDWYFWVFNAIILVINLVAAVLVFVAVMMRKPALMIPILAVTVLNQIMGLIYLGFSVAAIFTMSSPLAQKYVELFNTEQWFKDFLRQMGISISDYVMYYSIYVSVCVFIALLFNVWIFVTHFQTYKDIRDRQLHCHHIGSVPEVHITASSYPPPSSVYPDLAATQQYGYASAPAAESLSYPNQAYAYNPAAGGVERVDHAWK